MTTELDARERKLEVDPDLGRDDAAVGRHFRTAFSHCDGWDIFCDDEMVFQSVWKQRSMYDGRKSVR